MSKENSFGRPWLLRVLGKWIWLLGLLPQFLDYLSTYLPRDVLPPEVSRLLEAGGTWQATLILLAIGLLGSAYLVHQEDHLERERLARELDALRDTYPKLSVALRPPEGIPTATLTIPLLPIPDPPDFDEQVANKKRELLSKRVVQGSSSLPEALNTITALALASLFSDPNPDFDQEVEEYQPQYRKYLVQKYEVELPRAFHIHPIIANDGTTTATSVILEIQMPLSFTPAEHHQLAKLQGLDDEILEFVPTKPHEPKPTRPRIAETLALASFAPPPDMRVPEPPDADDPDLAQRSGRWHITYHIARIVPKRAYSDLNPFAIWALAAAPSDVWELAVRMYCAELPSPLQSQLRLVFV